MLKAKKDATTNAAARRKVILEIPGCASVWTYFRSVVEKNPSSPELYDPSKGMTSGGCSSGSAKYSFQDELSSRPERSVVEGSAVRPSGFPNSGVKEQSFHADSKALTILARSARLKSCPDTEQTIKKEASCLASFPFRLSLVLQGKVVAIQVHHLVPCRHEVLHERLLRVARCIDLRDGTELGV